MSTNLPHTIKTAGGDTVHTNSESLILKILKGVGPEVLAELAANEKVFFGLALQYQEHDSRKGVLGLITRRKDGSRILVTFNKNGALAKYVNGRYVNMEYTTERAQNKYRAALGKYGIWNYQSATVR